MYNALISVLSSIMIMLYIGLAIGIIYAIAKISDIRDYLERKALYKRLNKGRCSLSANEHLHQVFVLSSKEILLGEKIIGPNGNELKKISSIKDASTRLVAENSAEFIFSIDKENGNVYKILKFKDNDEKYYYKIDFPELNYYLEMNETVYKKYKAINASNWHEICSI